MKSPLHNQIFLPTAALLVLAVVLFTGISAWHAAAVRREQTASHMEAVANALGGASYPLTDDVVRRIGAMIGGDVVVLNSQQQIMSSTINADETLRSLLADLSVPTTNASAPQSLRWNSTSYLVTSIQRSRVRRPATLYVILAQEDFPVVWRNVIVAPAIAALVTLTLALFVTRLLARRIAKRVDQLRALFSRLAEGDFQPVTASGQDDEIRDLMVSANVLSEQLRAMQQELITAERLQLLGQLSGGLAHQLKNSVAGARLAIQLHQRRCNAQDTMIQTALAQLALTEEQVLAVVSLKATPSDSATEAAMEVCDLSRLVTDVAALLQPHCSHWKSQISLQLPDQLLTMVRSVQPLRGAVLNVMQNAVEAAGVGGRIACHVTSTSDHVVIDIRDSGPGFSDAHDQLLKAFHTTKPEGIGLGLTIAQHAVDQEQGLLSFQRIYDQTSVQIRLPRRPVKTCSATHSESTTEIAAAVLEDPFQKLRTL